MIGRTISHYEITAKLGQGGMGEVYLAQDLKLGRKVAIKFLPPHLSQLQEAKHRFLHEAQAASALDHSRIGVIHEIDETEDGQLFIVMAYYEGRTLKEKLAAGPLPVPEAVTIARDIAAGLANAHSSGIIHRDLKPANILFSANGEAKIVDFGLAKLTGATQLTQSGATLGTAAYMSPEQARGDEVDARADIFSLGIILYEMLAGRRPFGGDYEAALLYQIVHAEPEPLSGLCPEVPELLQEICAKAMAKDPAQRYQSARALQDELEVLAPGPASVSSLDVTRPLPRPARQAKIPPWRVAALVLAGAALATLAWTIRGGGDKDALDDLALAVMDFRNLGGAADDLTASVGMTGLLHVGLVENSPIRIVSPEYLHDLRRRLFGAARGPIEEGQALEVARKAGATILLSGLISATDAEPYVMWRLVDTRNGETLGGRRLPGDKIVALADQIIADALPLVAKACGLEVSAEPTSVHAVTTTSSEAYAHYVAGVLAREALRPLDAIGELEKAVALDTTFALPLLELSRIYYSGTGAGEQYGLAREFAERAWNLRARTGIKDRMRLEAWRERLDYHVVSAISNYRELLSRWPDDREILSDLHSVLFYYWYGADALEVAEKGLALYPDDLYFGLYYQIGLGHLGRYEEALTATRSYLQKHPDEPNSWDEMGIRYLGLGRPDSAEVAFRRALAIDPEFLPSQRGLGFCAYSRGDLDAAVTNHEELLQNWDLLPGQRVAVLTDTAFWPGLAWYHAEAGRFDAALQCFELARSSVSDPVSEIRLETGLSNLLLRMGRNDEVLRWTEDLNSRSEDRLAPLLAVQFRAKAMVALGNLSAARQAADELLATEQSWGGVARKEALKVLADIALAENAPQQALVHLQEIQQQCLPDGGLFDIEHREALARAYRLAGRPGEAIRVWKDLLAIYGSHALAYFELGRLYEEAGDAEPAIAQYDLFLQKWSQADENLPQVVQARRSLVDLESRS